MCQNELALSCSYTLCQVMEPKLFDAIIVKHVQSLETYDDMPSNFINVSFLYEQAGRVAFVQACPWYACPDRFVIEIARYITGDVLDDYYYVDDNNRKYKLYSIEPTDDIDANFTINILREIMVNNSCPDLSNWEDITKGCVDELAE